MLVFQNCEVSLCKEVRQIIPTLWATLYILNYERINMIEERKKKKTFIITNLRASLKLGGGAREPQPSDFISF